MMDFMNVLTSVPLIVYVVGTKATSIQYLIGNFLESNIKDVTLNVHRRFVKDWLRVKDKLDEKNIHLRTRTSEWEGFHTREGLLLSNSQNIDGTVHEELGVDRDMHWGEFLPHLRDFGDLNVALQERLGHRHINWTSPTKFQIPILDGLADYLKEVPEKGTNLYKVYTLHRTARTGHGKDLASRFKAAVALE